MSDTKDEDSILIGEDIRILKPSSSSNPMKAEPMRPRRGSDTPFYRGGKSRFIVFEDYDPTRELSDEIQSSMSTSLDKIEINPKDVAALTDSLRKTTDDLRTFLVREITALPLAIRQAWKEAQEIIRFAAGVDDLDGEDDARRFEQYVDICVKIKLLDKAVSLMNLPSTDRDLLVKSLVLKSGTPGSGSKPVLEELRDLLTGIVQNPDPPYGDTGG